MGICVLNDARCAPLPLSHTASRLKLRIPKTRNSSKHRAWVLHEDLSRQQQYRTCPFTKVKAGVQRKQHICSLAVPAATCTNPKPETLNPKPYINRWDVGTCDHFTPSLLPGHSEKVACRKGALCAWRGTPFVSPCVGVFVSPCVACSERPAGD